MRDEPEPDKPLDSYRIAESTSPPKKWTLLLYRDYLALESDDGKWHEVDRDELPERVELIDGAVFLRRVMVVTLRSKKIIFQLSPESFAGVRAWIGPLTREDLLVSLNRRLKWVTPIGVLFVLAALPIGDLEWEPVSLALGLSLIMTGRLAKLWPHRVFFAIDSLWFLCLAANSVWLLTQEWSWLRMGLLVLQLLLVRSGLKEYRRFAPMYKSSPDDLEQYEDRRDHSDR